MSMCPNCVRPLKHTTYEGFHVLRCGQCKGVLLPQEQLLRIGHKHEKNADTLKREAHEEFKGDNRKLIRCPKCQAAMEKRPLSTRYTVLNYDLCRSCGNVWLDGGELALMQLLFEHSIQGEEGVEFQKRMKELELSPERQARFEAALAKLPTEEPETDPDFPVELLLWLLNIPVQK